MATKQSKTSRVLEQAKALFGKKVEDISQKEEGVKDLVAGVLEKLSLLRENFRFKKLVEPLSVFIRMIRAHFSGGYKLSYTSLGLLLLALVYFISPIDMIPDFLGFFGFADDLSVILAVFSRLKDEIQDFLEWERTHL